MHASNSGELKSMAMRGFYRSLALADIGITGTTPTAANSQKTEITVDWRPKMCVPRLA
jgi:hypothetical protein